MTNRMLQIGQILSALIIATFVVDRTPVQHADICSREYNPNTKVAVSRQGNNALLCGTVSLSVNLYSLTRTVSVPISQ